jgi:hypothetical protein
MRLADIDEAHRIVKAGRPAPLYQAAGDVDLLKYLSAVKLLVSGPIREEEYLPLYWQRALEQLRADGRSGKIRAFVILPNGDLKSLPETWWRGSQSLGCLSGSPHPDGELRIRESVPHELNSAESRQLEALAWLRAQYNDLRNSEKPSDKWSCHAAFVAGTHVKLSDLGWNRAWKDFVKEVKGKYPDIDRQGRKRKPLKTTR